MVYLAFDLDGTLGRFLPISNLLCPFNVVGHFRKFPQKIQAIHTSMNDALRWELDIAYSAFVKRVADLETSDKPLGIFRPGIFKVFEMVSRLRKMGLVTGVIMYTNNSSSTMYNFANDVIKYVNKGPVFDDILDYVHPLRLISPGSSLPSPFKTWVELKELLIKSKTKAKPTIGPNEVLFFDDMPHPDMFAKLGANFIKLDEYSGRPTNERLKAVFLAALNDSGLLSPAFKELFFTYSAACTYGTKANDVQDFLTRLTTTMMGTIIGGPNVSGAISDTDSGNCTTMIDALTGLIPATKNNNAENLRAIKRPRRTNKNGGFRKRTRRKYKSLYRFY